MPVASQQSPCSDQSPASLELRPRTGPRRTRGDLQRACPVLYVRHPLLTGLRNLDPHETEIETKDTYIHTYCVPGRV